MPRAKRLWPLLCVCLGAAGCVGAWRDTTYDGVKDQAVTRADTKADLFKALGGPDVQTADGRFLLYRVDRTRQWSGWAFGGSSGEAGPLFDVDRPVDLLMEFDAANRLGRRTTQRCAQARKDICAAPSDATLWAAIASALGEERAAEYRETEVRTAKRAVQLHAAASDGDVETLRRLLAEGASPRVEIDGVTPLHVAAAKGRVAVVEALVASGAAVDVRDALEGRTPLYVAASLGQDEVVERLLALGADVDDADAGGVTALHAAVGNGHAGAAARLIAAGARVNVKSSGYNSTPLHLAANAGDVGLVAQLLEAGANVDATAEPDRGTPLHRAILAGQVETVELLVRNGAGLQKTIRVIGSDGRYHWRVPAELAAEQGREDIVRLLEPVAVSNRR